MKLSKIFLSLVLTLLLALSLNAQTYLYIENISISPAAPTSSDMINITVSGNMSATNVIVQNEQVFINGNNITFSFDVSAPGIGLTVLVPYSHVFTVGPLNPGWYYINLAGSFVGDFVPQIQKEFYVSGEITECETYFTFYHDTINPSPLSMDIYVFTDMSNGNNIISWYWVFGDGGTSTLQNPSHGYFNMTPGVYPVCLTILTSDSCTSNWCDTVYINWLPPTVCEADFIFSPDTVNPPPLSMDLYQFEDMSTGNNIISWLWDFGDGSTSTLQDPVHGYFNMMPGQYTVCLTITTFDNCTDTFCDTVTVNVNPPYCIAEFSYSLNTLVNCINCYDFTDNSFASGNIISWFWDFDDGSYSSDQNPMHTFSSAGEYNICLNIITDDGCSSFFCDSLVIVDSIPADCDADFSYVLNPSAIPEIFIAEFYDISFASSNIVSWYWDFGDGNSSIDQNPVHSYWMSNWGINNVCLTITTATGCTSTYCEQIYVGYDPCMMTMTYSVTDVSFSGGNNGAIDVTPQGGNPPYQFYWNNGETTEDISGLSQGNYVLWLIDSYGCSQSEVIIVDEIISQPDSQLIQIPPGWSSFSTYIDPFFPDIEDVVSANVNYISLIKDGDGMVYWPDYSVNAIGNIELGEGFQIKVLGPDSITLNIQGIAAQPELVPVNIPVGWSLIGYLRQSSIDITQAFSSIIAPPYTNGDLIIVKNYSGDIFWPYFDVNNIVNLNPGEAYQLKMANSASIFYPPN